MKLQKKISEDLQKKYVGQTLKVLIDEKQKGDQNIYLGRTQYDAPEVDGIVFVDSSRELTSGDFVDVTMNDSFEYDLAGVVV